jgi:hypothetical protein
MCDDTDILAVLFEIFFEPDRKHITIIHLDAISFSMFSESRQYSYLLYKNAGTFDTHQSVSSKLFP